MDKGPTWVYGITTVPERKESTLKDTIASLKEAGFTQPLLFVDGEDEPTWWKNRYGLRTIGRYPRIGAWGNWFLALHEMYVRVPNASRYVLFQDDIVAVKNLRQYLETQPFPKKAYWNLITYPDNYMIAPDKGTIGWFPASARKRGLGAQGLVFDREGVMALLTSQHAQSRPQHADRGKQNIDGGVVDALNRVGIKELVHNPSLIKHVNSKSIIGHGPQPEASSFPGAAFDAMEFTKLKSMQSVAGAWMFGDHVARALSTVGITPERVTEWIGAECGCKERRQRLNELGVWGKRVLDGAVSGAKEKLEGLMGRKL